MEQDMNRHSLSISSSEKNRRFIFRLFLALLLLACYIYHVLPQYEKGYNAALIDKADRLVSISGPKIVLLGNSNVAFGMDSRMIEEELGVPVVNMGLHGGYGNPFHENMSRLHVVPGDIYVICHGSFKDKGQINDTMAVWSSIENHFYLWRILRFEDIETMARSFPVYLKKSLDLYSSGKGNQDPGGVYARNAFNEYGDIAVIREEGGFPFEETVSPSGISDVAVGRINRLNQYLKERGASLVVAGYPIGNGKLTEDAENFIAFQKELTERLDCPVISNYADYMLDYMYFYNSTAHLNTEGAKLRTVQLITDLKNWRETGMDADPDRDVYTDIVADDDLSRIRDISGYLEALNEAKNRYTVIISAKGDASDALNDDIYDKLRTLGITSELKKGYGYITVIENGQNVLEECGMKKLQEGGLFDDCRMRYLITSGGYEKGNVSSILLNGQEYSRNSRGLNFVVYSNETHRIIDEVCFDTASERLTVTR